MKAFGSSFENLSAEFESPLIIHDTISISTLSEHFLILFSIVLVEKHEKIACVF